jgi:hypothetical protein
MNRAIKYWIERAQKSRFMRPDSGKKEKLTLMGLINLSKLEMTVIGQRAAINILQKKLPCINLF